MSFSVKPYFYHLAGAIFFLFLGTVAHADMLSTSTVLSSVAKKAPLSAQASSSVARPVPRRPAAHLVQASKRKPGQIKRSGFNLNNISPTALRRKLSSRSAIVMDTYSGQILYAHEPDRTGQPASTIKILTGLIAMKSLRDTSIVKVSHKASKMPRSKIYLHQGREYKADDMINAVLIASANDASVALAEQIAGSEQTFTKLMNHKARELGARSTHCKSASGLTVRGQKSTVRDLATIFNGAMQDEEFAHRIGKVRTRTSYGRQLKNHNRALWRIDGALGGKTGYTHLARQTYVGMFQRQGQAITVALMGSETMWDDLSNLVEYGFVRRGQFVAGGKLSQQPAPAPSLSHLAEAQGSAAAADGGGRALLLSQTSKQRIR